MSKLNKILFLGDSHGNQNFFAAAFAKAAEYNCDAIFQLGDFGWWPHSGNGLEFISYISYTATTLGIPVYWLDGNHENFHHLLERDWPVTDDGFWEVNPNLYYSPRGHIWSWGDKNFMSMGGAYSIDKEWRLQQEAKSSRQYSLWWPEETITQSDFYTAVGLFEAHAKKIDVFLAHDKPALVQIPNFESPFPGRIWPESENNGKFLQALVDIVKPKLILHGHWHWGYTQKLYRPDYEATCIGLSHDGYPEAAWMVMDLTGGWHEEKD